MPSSIRPADWEHFSIVRESLSLDHLHVAMVGRDRGQLLDYAAALAVALSEQDGWHVEKYEPNRIETLIVDLMLNRFDAALQTVSGQRTLPTRRRSGCVLFIPEAQAIPRAAFQQLIKLATGTRDHRLRLVALFPGSSQACKERIAWMGGQVARWDLDDDAGGSSARAWFADTDTPSRTPGNSGKHYRNPKRSLARATVAVAMALALAVLTLMWPTISDLSFDQPMNVQAPAQNGHATTIAGTVGPESLPISAPPAREKGNDADLGASHNDNQPTVHSISSDNNSVGITEAGRQ